MLVLEKCNLGIALANGSGSASNYSLSSASFEISQRPLTLVGSKVYDGATSIQGSDITTFTNIVGSETLLVTGSGSVLSANVGSGKSVTTGSLSLANNTGLASNYSISSTSASITHDQLTYQVPELMIQQEQKWIRFKFSKCGNRRNIEYDRQWVWSPAAEHKQLLTRTLLPC